MRLADLLDSNVVDEGGRVLGHVTDVRATQSGPLQGAFGAALQVDGLVVGGTRVGVRLGYERTDIRGPWLLKRLFQWLHHDQIFVPWSRVSTRETGTIRVSGDAADLKPPEPLS